MNGSDVHIIDIVVAVVIALAYAVTAVMRHSRRIRDITRRLDEFDARVAAREARARAAAARLRNDRADQD